MIDARSQTGTAPDEQTAMRYPTRASELDHRRLQVPPSPLHDPSPNQLHAGERASVPVVFAVLDKGPASRRSALPSRAMSCHLGGHDWAPTCRFLTLRGGWLIVLDEYSLRRRTSRGLSANCQKRNTSCAN